MQFFLFVLIVFVASVTSQKLPSYIVPCVRTKPDFHQCCIDNGIKAIPHILKGDRAYKIPPLAPLKLPKVALQPNNNLKITLTDLEIQGIETVTLKDIVFDFDNNQIRASLVMEYLTVLAQYEIDGRLLVPLRGNGPCNITSSNPNIEYQVDFKVIQKNGKDYMQVVKDSLTLKSGKTYYLLDNLFGNQQLSDETNRILNENSIEVGKELNGPISETIRTVVTELIKNYLTRLPMDDIFLKE